MMSSLSSLKITAMRATLSWVPACISCQDSSSIKSTATDDCYRLHLSDLPGQASALVTVTGLCITDANNETGFLQYVWALVVFGGSLGYRGGGRSPAHMVQ